MRHLQHTPGLQGPAAQMEPPRDLVAWLPLGLDSLTITQGLERPPWEAAETGTAQCTSLPKGQRAQKLNPDEAQV